MNSKIPKGQTEIASQKIDKTMANKMKRTHNTSLKTKAGVTRTLPNQGEFYRIL